MQYFQSKPVFINLPQRFTFAHYGDYNFNNTLGLFDWTLKNSPVVIDLRRCTSANYQALSLLVLYIWHLRNQGCYVTVLKVQNERYGASKMWRLMGANGWFQVLGSTSNNFWSHNYKPLLAIRNNEDFRVAVKKAESYTRGFDVEYEKTLRYVLSELLYNTLEHGKHHSRIPSLIQFVYYRDNEELSFIVADLGIGIRSHLRQAYPHLESDAEAIRFALNSQVSGTFAQGSPYAAQNNAGVGLYLSSNIIRKLHADMHIVSGRGVVHVSPTDITERTIPFEWPGTFVNVRLKLSLNPTISLQKMMSEFRAGAKKELDQGSRAEEKAFYYLNIKNYFGSYAEDKERAINIRDRYLAMAITGGQGLQLDFEEVVSAPHSFLSALLASPIRQLGMTAYKRIKVINAAPEIRETIDFILDENTATTGFTIVHSNPPLKQH
jgi:hypothetical protein